MSHLLYIVIRSALRRAFRLSKRDSARTTYEHDTNHEDYTPTIHPQHLMCLQFRVKFPFSRKKDTSSVSDVERTVIDNQHTTHTDAKQKVSDLQAEAGPQDQLPDLPESLPSQVDATLDGCPR